MCGFIKQRHCSHNFNDFFCRSNQQYDIIDNPAHICLSVKDSKIHSYQTYGTFYASYHAIRSNS